MTGNKTKLQEFLHYFRHNWGLYLLVLPVIVYFAIFLYWPMYGVLIAFKDFVPSAGIWGSEWVGFHHFTRFFTSLYFSRTLVNTLSISLLTLLFGFPAPILLAIMLNEVRVRWFKNTLQTITYAPHFISTVVMCGMITMFLSPTSGMFNMIREAMGLEAIGFLQNPKYFRTIYVVSEVWQHTGWSSIIYIAALSGIDPTMYEAADVDGATKMQKIWFITLPALVPTIVIMLILNCGSIMSVGFDKAFLLQNDLNRETSEIISTYVYRIGLTGGQYSFSAAVGLFNNVVNCILLIIVNTICSKLGETSLW